jgi:hypothetical protein
MLPGWLCRHRLFGHLEHRFAVAAIEDEVETVLVGVSDCRNALPAALQREQVHGLRGIVVPHIVVHFLEMPPALAGVDVERDGGGGEEIHAGAFGAVFVGRGVDP